MESRILCQENVTLSQHIVNFPTSSLISEQKHLRKIDSLQAQVASMCSTSVVDKVFTTYRLLIKLMAQPNIMNAYPLVDVLLSISPAQLESTNP